jgi:TolB protein
MWMASSLALAACGDVGMEAEGAPAQERVEQQAQEAVSERRIILYRTPSGEVYIVDGQGVTRLVARRATPLVYSPDGRRAAFSKLPDTWNVGDPVDSAELHVFELGSGRLAQLTSGHADIATVWTPDSRYLLFVSTSRDAEATFWQVKANGTGLEQLALLENGPNERRIILYIAPPADDSEVQWGPNERRIILYKSVGPDGKNEVRVVRFTPAFDVESAESLGEGTDPRWTERGTVVFSRDGAEVEVSVE